MSDWIGSPNFTAGRGGQPVLGVVVHWMDGRLAGTDSVFQDRARNTSAHYGSEDGVVHQYVKEEDTAYQAGVWVVNEQTIGIENSAEPGRSPSEATYEATAQLVANAAKRWGFAINNNTVRHHFDIVATQCSGQVANGGVDRDRIVRRANELAGELHPTNPTTPVPSNPAGTAEVTVDLLYVRSAPNSKASLAGSQQLTKGQTFQYQGLVQGESVSGVSTWIHTSKGNYVWAGGTNLSTGQATTPPVHTPTGGTATVVRVTNVRVAPNTRAALGGSKQLQAGQTFGYSALVHGETVSQNGVTTDLWAHSNVGNYVWWGNCK